MSGLSWVRPWPLVGTLADLRAGRRDLIGLVGEVCDRIDALEPWVQALLPEEGRRERLLREAKRLQERFPMQEGRPPLYGMLLGVKDILQVEDFVMRAGSALPERLFRGTQASCVSKLCEMGALVLGKTVTAEFASDEPGPTRNPHHLGHTPGGSSSGSAAGVAAGFCMGALGTQTGGSIVRPAAFCGVVGFKPTYGRIETDGMIGHAVSLDTIGVFAGDVAGVGVVASVLCGGWRETSVTGLPVIGVPDGAYLEQVMPEALEKFEEQVGCLERAGYRVKRVALFKDLLGVRQRYRNLSSAEMAEVHAVWFEEYEGLYRRRTAEKIRAGRKVSIEQVEVARAGRGILRSEIEEVMRQEEIDVWVCPAAVGAAPEGIENTGDTGMNVPWSYAGMSVLSLPVGKAKNDLPLGLQVVATSMRDEELLKWGEGMMEEFKRGF